MLEWRFMVRNLCWKCSGYLLDDMPTLLKKMFRVVAFELDALDSTVTADIYSIDYQLHDQITKY